MANANIVTLQDEVGNEMFPRTLASAVFSSTGNPIATQDVLCTQAEYDSFPDTKLTDGKKYFIDDGMTPQQRADGVFYDDTDTQLGSNNVQGAISALNSNLTNTIEDLDGRLNIKFAVTSDTYTQTDNRYTSWISGTYRIMTSLTGLTNSNQFLQSHGANNCIALSVSCVRADDRTYMMPCNVGVSGEIRGLCKLNEAMTIRITWAYWD